jgi:SHS2 domain-containing protein
VFRWVEHTAELELEIEAPSEDEVFEQALSALAELLSRGEHGDASVSKGDALVSREVAAEGPDRPALLAAWLEELAFLAESEGFVAMRVEELHLGQKSLEATVVGWLGQPPPLVKAVTYHRLAFAPASAGYRATVVLDV